MSDCPFTPKEVGAIVSAFTGYVLGDFAEMQLYADRLLGRPVWTHEFAAKGMEEKMRELSKPDFIKLDAWCRGSKLPPLYSTESK
jgi:hypothetical protein